jgi:hypothetical protein
LPWLLAVSGVTRAVISILLTCRSEEVLTHAPPQVFLGNRG